jgi:hypothetical protein
LLSPLVQSEYSPCARSPFSGGPPIPETTSFAELLRRVRSGDQEAATALVRQFEPEIRRVVRLRLTDPRMRRVIDSADICQSVLANFFVRAAAG